MHPQTCYLPFAHCPLPKPRPSGWLLLGLVLWVILAQGCHPHRLRRETAQFQSLQTLGNQRLEIRDCTLVLPSRAFAFTFPQFSDSLPRFARDDSSGAVFSLQAAGGQIRAKLWLPPETHTLHGAIRTGADTLLQRSSTASRQDVVQERTGGGATAWALAVGCLLVLGWLAWRRFS